MPGVSPRLLKRMAQFSPSQRRTNNVVVPSSDPLCHVFIDPGILPRLTRHPAAYQDDALVFVPGGLDHIVSMEAALSKGELVRLSNAQAKRTKSTDEASQPPWESMVLMFQPP